MKRHKPTKPVVRPLQELHDWMRVYECTQPVLAERLGVTQAYISLILNGKRDVSLEMSLRIAVLTNVQIDQLLKDRELLRILKLWVERLNHAA